MNLISHPHEHPHSEEDRRLNTFGFALYDIIHIFCAVSFLVLIINDNANVALDNGFVQSKILLEMADEFTELVMSFALIFFIKFIYEAKTTTNARNLYSFAWLIVSISLAIPSTFELPFLYMFPWPENYGLPLYVITSIDTYLPLAAFLSFLICLTLFSKEKHWRIALNIGMGLLCLFSLTSATVYIAQETALGGLKFSYQTICRFLFCSAPLFPSIMTFLSLYKKEKTPKDNQTPTPAKPNSGI